MFNIHWGNSADLLAVAQAAGAGALKQRKRDQDREDARFLLGLQQQQEQLDANVALRAQEQADQQQRFYDAQAIEQAQRQDYLAAQEAGALQGQQFDLARDQQNFEQQSALQQQQEQMLAQRTLDQQANDELKRFRQAKLDPEGRRRFNDLASDLRQIQAERGVTLTEEAYQDVLGQWYGDLRDSDLAQYEIKEPTIQEQLAQKTIRGPYGSLLGLDRNGMFRKLEEPPPMPLTQQQVDAATYTYPDGTRLFINPNTSKETVIPAPKPEKGDASSTRAPGLVLDDQYDKEYEAAYGRLYTAWAMNSEEGDVYDPKPEEVRKEMERYLIEKNLYYGRTPAPETPVTHGDLAAPSPMLPPQAAAPYGGGQGTFGMYETQRNPPGYVGPFKSPHWPQTPADVAAQQQDNSAIEEAAARANYQGPIKPLFVEAPNPEAASVLDDGTVFTVNGQPYLKVGPGLAEPLSSASPSIETLPEDMTVPPPTDAIDRGPEYVDEAPPEVVPLASAAPTDGPVAASIEDVQAKIASGEWPSGFVFYTPDGRRKVVP